ncbi:MAG: hypothetical protein ACXACA_05690 [Candidatus Ranarchaeia archaeon]
MVEFILGNFQNYYSNPAIRKNPHTISLLEKILTKILDSGWEPPSKAAWLQSTKSQQYYENLSIALNDLKQRKKGSLFVNLVDPKTKDMIFIRWYNNTPQQDVLSVEASFAISQGRLIEATPMLRAKEIVEFLKEPFKSISIEHTRPLDSTFIGLQKLSLLSDDLTQPFQRVHTEIEEDSK